MNSNNNPDPILFRGITKDYLWGKALDSIVGSLSENKELKNYAEIWFGDHPSGAGLITNSKEPLDQLIKNNADRILSKSSIEQFGKRLPYLFKFLSIAKPLSIQAHPNSEQAKILHLEDAKAYPDPYPKPEVGIALTDVSLLYGFKSPDEISKLLISDDLLPELKSALGTETIKICLKNLENADELNKIITTKLFESSKEIIKETTFNYLARISNKSNITKLETALLKIKDDFPDGDIGFIFCHLLNYIELAPFQAIFIDAGIPHAYLSGELAECMSASDNVVRTGLTVKKIDQHNLIKILDYTPRNYRPVTVFEDSFLNYHTKTQDYFKLKVIHKPKAYKLTTNLSANLIVPYSTPALITTTQEKHTIALGSAVLLPYGITDCQIDSEGVVFVTA
jgi:mannose-6-phosphate isomerase